MTREQVVAEDTTSLKAKILAATGTESGTESIMRSLERMCTDSSIEFFEMTLVSNTRKFGGHVTAAAWRVRADRGRTEE
jgi:hypothetical protein